MQDFNEEKNVKRKNLNQVLIAGAFGSYINPESAKLIGLVPDVPTEKIKSVGNTALTGAKMALISREARKTAETLSKKIRYLELTVDPISVQSLLTLCLFHIKI